MGERYSGKVIVELTCNKCQSVVITEEIEADELISDTLEDIVAGIYKKNGHNYIDEISECDSCK